MQKAMSILPKEAIMFGSDAWPWHKNYREYVEADFSILQDLGAGTKFKECMFSRNFDDFLNLPK